MRDFGALREAPVRFGSVTVWGGNSSSRSGFRFWLLLCKKGFSVFQFNRAGPKGVSTKGVSTNRSNFPYFRALSTAISKKKFRIRPDHGYPFCRYPFGPCRFNRKERFRFRCRFLANISGSSGSAFGLGKNGSDGSGFRFRFGS